MNRELCTINKELDEMGQSHSDSASLGSNPSSPASQNGGFQPPDAAGQDGNLGTEADSPTHEGWHIALRELINPSDPYTFRTDDFEALAFGVTVISDGQCSIKELDGERTMPLFFLGGDPDEWWRETFGHAIAEFIPWQQRVADALDTNIIGNQGRRLDYESAVSAIDDPAKRAAYAKSWHDRHRSSMNDIGSRVRAWVKKLRKSLLTPSPVKTEEE